jgi:hypothetical protein
MLPIRTSLQELARGLQETLDQESVHAEIKTPACQTLSSWRLAAVGVQTLRVQVQGSWTLSAPSADGITPPS